MAGAAILGVVAGATDGRDLSGLSKKRMKATNVNINRVRKPSTAAQRVAFIVIFDASLTTGS